MDLPHGLKLEQVQRYLENRTKEFGTLQAACEARDWAAIRGITHRVKGNAALYGMAELGLSAAAVVHALDRGDEAEITGLVDALQARLKLEIDRFGQKKTEP